MIDPNHPFYDAPWRRGLIVAVCFAWVGVELYFGNLTWAAILACIGLFAGYKLFFDRGNTPR
ncbi:DUF3329 domain-containing protein [Neorhizobium sp. NPDC001467]|uniref:DUF3329 domain-containing protein n=1 Tax=Neorhizobium sp. NPDC001467 TaxID=3390595 RepID=UPI003D008D63